MDTDINSLAMLFPLMFGMNMSQWARQHNTAKNTGVPGSVNTQVLNAQSDVQKNMMKKKGRLASNVTGGLLGAGTLGQASLWGQV
jgi:hypothetical protein